jgi:hypothetical protein
MQVHVSLYAFVHRYKDLSMHSCQVSLSLYDSMSLSLYDLMSLSLYTYRSFVYEDWRWAPIRHVCVSCVSCACVHVCHVHVCHVCDTDGGKHVYMNTDT